MVLYIARMRTRLFAAVLMLLAASCGGTDQTQATSAPTEDATEAPATTQGSGATAAPGTTTGSGEAPGETTAAPGTEAPRTEGPAAPGFTTILSDGTTFDLADHGKPVYMVFWAEW